MFFFYALFARVTAQIEMVYSPLLSECGYQSVAYPEII